MITIYLFVSFNEKVMSEIIVTMFLTLSECTFFLFRRNRIYIYIKLMFSNHKLLNDFLLIGWYKLLAHSVLKKKGVHTRLCSARLSDSFCQ